jgi:ADP-ribosylglycohydrolase
VDSWAERVYAGVLGKIVGVYLGRPFEQWTHDQIESELGEITGYVTGHPAIEPAKRDNPLVLTDDDVSGTFTFLRALEDYGLDVTTEQIGQTWLNYIVEERSTHWWGGVGVSTEHTAYLHLKHGLPVPRSTVLSEQIGAQIFIDGWAMTCPGDPERAADLARRAASVSHDGEAVHAAQVVAAMEAQAFVEPGIERLLDTGAAFIPGESVIASVIEDVRGWHAADGDWRRTRERIEERYGYHRYRGICHVVPNHALIVLGLLYGDGDFDRSLMVVNTAGWDTDCNSGNLGCLLGIRGGVEAIGPKWREPVRDRLYLSSADGGRAITDAVAEAVHLINLGRPEEPWRPPRFHFSFPGSVQGFDAAHDGGALAVDGVTTTPTFIPREALAMTGYELQASPTLYPGQTVRAEVEGASARLLIRVYDEHDGLVTLRGPGLEWRIPDTGGRPIAEVGVETDGPARLRWLTWDGAPDVTLGRAPGTMWRRAWVHGVDDWGAHWPEAYRLIQNRGTGLLIQGTRDWTDYEVGAAIVPETIAAAGLAARVQGMRRYYALLLRPARAQLVRELDGTTVLAEAPFIRRDYDTPQELTLRVAGDSIEATVGDVVLRARDGALTGGAVALVCEFGCLTCEAVRVRPAGSG